MASASFTDTALDDFPRGEKLEPLYTSTSGSSVYTHFEDLNLDGRLVSLYPSTSDTFIYTALEDPTQDGRLITLYPSAANGSIVCNMIDVKITSMLNFRYEALSYVWGSEIPTREIHINGKTKLVRENLWLALRHLRLSDKTRVLWVDAICINQESIEERNHQVRRMGEIYGRASTVLIWLGPKGGFSDLAFSFIKRMEMDARRETEGGSITSFSDKWVVSGGLCIFWSALKNLCLREYWERLWIIQEIGLARNIELYCGPDHVPGDLFYAVLQRGEHSWRRIAMVIENPWIERQRRHPRSKNPISDREARLLEQTLSQIKTSLPDALFRMRKARNGKTSLRELCIGPRNSVCFDPRDKVFGLFGLAFDAPTMVDYSMTLFDLFQRTLLASNHSEKNRSADLVLARNLQHSFAMSLSDKTVEQVQQVKDLFGLPSMESTKLFHTTGHLVGSIERLDSAWPNGVIGHPAPNSQSWLQHVTTSAIEELRRRLRFKNENLYEELQSEIDLVQPIKSSVSYVKVCLRPDHDFPSRHAANVAKGQSSNMTKTSLQRMILKNDNCNTSGLQVFRVDFVGLSVRTHFFRQTTHFLEHPQGLVPHNASLNDLICAIDIPSIECPSAQKDTVHIVLRWHGDGYSIVGKAFVPPHCRDLRTDDHINLWMSALVLQLITV